MALVSVLGVFLVVTSRNERLAEVNPIKAERPRPPDQDEGFPGDHWHVAYGVYVCDRFAPAISNEADPRGIHTHKQSEGEGGDGVIHVHPFTSASSGRKATLGVFLDTVGMTLTADEIKLPGDRTYSEGDKCGNDPGKVRIFLNGEEYEGDPKDIRLRDRDLLVIAFAADGAEVPRRPPSAASLDALSDVPGSPAATTSTVQAPTGTTAPPESSPPASTPPPAPAPPP
jgi:hypothetical protein